MSHYFKNVCAAQVHLDFCILLYPMTLMNTGFQ